MRASSRPPNAVELAQDRGRAEVRFLKDYLGPPDPEVRARGKSRTSQGKAVRHEVEVGGLDDYGIVEAELIEGEDGAEVAFALKEAVGKAQAVPDCDAVELRLAWELGVVERNRPRERCRRPLRIWT